MRRIRKIYLKTKPGKEKNTGLLNFGNRTFLCKLGRSGMVSRKIEGDGGTPTGKFQLLYGYFNRRRVFRQNTSLRLVEVKATMGWCDQPRHRAYNRQVKLPFSASHEKLLRDDRLYDICIVLNYNIMPKVHGRGSAIFFHLTSPEGKPTEGCVAVEPAVMQKILPFLSSSTEIVIQR